MESPCICTAPVAARLPRLSHKTSAGSPQRLASRLNWPLGAGTVPSRLETGLVGPAANPTAHADAPAASNSAGQIARG